MPAPARSALLLVAVLTGSVIGCGSSLPRDVNYGTGLGADFVPPIVDAGQDGATAGAGGTASAGAGGAAGGGAGGTDVTGLAGADGGAGAGGTGS